MNSEKNALGRVLLISKEAYASVASGELPLNIPALLDCLSAALSHVNDEKQPLAKIMGKLKREIRSKNREFYKKTALCFSKVYPVLDYDLDKALRHVPAIIYGNDKINEQLVAGDKSRVKAMCDAMKSYPGFLFGEFEALSDKQFYELVFGYYPKLYSGEDFMGEMRFLFGFDEPTARPYSNPTLDLPCNTRDCSH